MIRSALHLLLALVLSAWIATPVWAGYAEGKAAFDEGDYDKAFAEFLPLSERENINAQYYLGILYRNGWGVLQDDGEAARWLRFAAYQGHVEAQYTMGYMYQHGQGVTKDLVEAKRWYLMAARQGDIDAQQSLNILYFDEKNDPRTRRAGQGDIVMSANPGGWIDSILSMIIGGDNVMSVGVILTIAAIILIVVIPLVMPFSFFRIKPLMQQLAKETAARDRALLEEFEKLAPLLREIADSKTERDQAMLVELRRLTGSHEEENSGG